MPDFKCVACRIRIRRIGDPPHCVAGSCPSCGSRLVPVGELADVVGFRSVTTADVLVGGHAVVGDFTMRRDVRDALDAQRWIDDGGSAVVAVALPTSDRRLLPDAGAPGQNGTT